MMETEDKTNNNSLYRTYEKSLRLFAAMFVFMYGIMKPIQFGDSFTSNDNPVNELSGMGLMWAFFGYSMTVPIFVGIFECTGAVLLAINRTKVLGALVLLPVLSNVVLFDLVYGVTLAATVNGIFFLAIVLFVLFQERAKLILLLESSLVNEHSVGQSKRSFFQYAILAGFVFLNFVGLMLIIKFAYFFVFRVCSDN